MKVHELKTVQPFFDQVAHGEKRYELRLNDRDFKWDDILILREYSLVNQTYQGNEVVVRVKGILQNFTGLKDNYCILTISDPI